MTITTPYKPKSNMITSLSIRKKDEEDYLNLKNMLKQQRISTGEYLIDAYRAGMLPSLQMHIEVVCYLIYAYLLCI